jgi:protein SCO1/2
MLSCAAVANRRWFSKLFFGALTLAAAANFANAQYARPALTKGVALEQKLNSPVPLNLVFHDESNRSVVLGKYFGDKPVVLSIVYFTCASLCPMSLHESVMSLKRISLEPGRDYNMVVVSFDPADTPTRAAEVKAKYRTEFASGAHARSASDFDQGWHFLTGNEASIKQLTDAVGFRYRFDVKTQQFVHAGGIMVATPDGKLSRYLYGIDYAAADLRMALVDASQHKIGSPADYLLLFCFHYDAAQGRYTLAIVNVLKIAAAMTVIMLAGLIFLLMRSDKKKKETKHWKELTHVG